MPIRRLPPHVVNQIAAGEVVERPASVVKELLENSLDAGATRIEVSIEGGGLEGIEVADDGGGIAAEELPLAVAPHATSKIEHAADLEQVATLGFRGEALASIASVSAFSIRSCRREETSGAIVEVEGGEVGPVRPAAGAPGTTVTVRHLFMNAPARRKFLKTTATETTRAVEVVRTAAIARPDVAFRVVVDGRVALDLPATAELSHRVAGVLGEEVGAGLLAVEGDPAALPRAWGFVGRPDLSRASSRSQRIYLNGRPIQDRLVVHALREGFRGAMPGDRHPLAVLFLDVAPGEVDVNVHPAKTEVRFRSPEAVHAAVRRAVRAALGGSDLVPSVETDLGSSSWSLRSPRSDAGRSQPILFSGASGTAATSRGAGWTTGATRSPAGFDYAAVAAAIASAVPAPPAPDELDDRPRRRRVLQVGGLFLVSGDEEGLVIVDQHALHERLMFESLRRRITEGPLERQALLAPATASASAEAIEAIESSRMLLERLGFEVEPFGPRTIAVRAVPSLLGSRGVEATSFVVDLLERAAAEGPVPDEAAALEDVLAMMACKASVRAGDSLTDAEGEALLGQALESEGAASCPHGRPTMLRIPWSDLRRRFGRSS